MLHSFDFRNELVKDLGKDPAVSVLESEESGEATEWTLRKHCSDPTPGMATGPPRALAGMD